MCSEVKKRREWQRGREKCEHTHTATTQPTTDLSNRVGAQADAAQLIELSDGVGVHVGV